jgi:hypothetical protein
MRATTPEDLAAMLANAEVGKDESVAVEVANYVKSWSRGNKTKRRSRGGMTVRSTKELEARQKRFDIWARDVFPSEEYQLALIRCTIDCGGIDTVDTIWGTIDVREFRPPENEPIIEREAVAIEAEVTAIPPPEPERRGTRDLRDMCQCLHRRIDHDMAMLECNACTGGF